MAAMEVHYLSSSIILRSTTMIEFCFPMYNHVNNTNMQIHKLKKVLIAKQVQYVGKAAKICNK